jgi:hypothetical protein
MGRDTDGLLIHYQLRCRLLFIMDDHSIIFSTEMSIRESLIFDLEKPEAGPGNAVSIYYSR